MEIAVRAAAVCVAGALLGLVVRRSAPAMGLVLSLGIVAAVLLSLAGAAAELAASFRELAERSGLSPALTAPLYKTLAVALIVRTGSGLCRDAGDTALASVLETAGAVCALLASLPLLRAVMEMLWGLMG